MWSSFCLSTFAIFSSACKYYFCNDKKQYSVTCKTLLRMFVSSSDFSLDLQAPKSTVGCPINQSQNTGLKAPPPPCCCSAAQLFPTLCISMDCSTPGFLSFTISQNLLKLMSIELVMPSNHLILCYPLLLLPSIFLSISVFSFFPMSHRFASSD